MNHGSRFSRAASGYPESGAARLRNMRLPLRAALLAGIPLAIMTAIGVVLVAQGKSEDGRSTLVVGVIVAAVCGASVIYLVEQWSLKKQSLIHFAVMAVTVLPALFLSGWFPLDTVGGYFAVIGVFLVVGALLWGALYLIFTKLVSRQRA